MIEELLSFVGKRRLIAEGDRVLVALSGGADSTCLLHLLAAAGFDVAAAHLHHSQRAEGDADVETCRALCQSLGVEFYAGKADVPAVAAAHKIGVEEAGRKLRYEFLQMVATEGFQKIATGHTSDDNIETMLLNLARGSGMRGLAGIPPSRDNVIRPILFMSREQTHRYCEEHGLAYVQDSFNEDESFARNLIRSRAVPPLKQVNPSAADHALLTAQILREEDALLDAVAASHLAASEEQPTHALAFIERRVRSRWSGMQELPIALVRRCVRLAATMYGGQLDFNTTQDIAEAIHKGRHSSYTAEGGVVAVTTTETGWAVTLHEPVEPFRELLTLDGETIADDFGWSLAAWHGHVEDGPLQATLDKQRLKGDLFARKLKKGDRINLPGSSSGKSLSERLARAGFPEAVRLRLPVVCDMLGPIWAPGVGSDARVSGSSETASPLALRLQETPLT